MERHFLTIDGSKFFLRADTDLDALAGRLAAAVKEGGDVVTLEVAGRGTIRVIATPGIPIIIETEVEEGRNDSVSSFETSPSEATWTETDEFDLGL